MGFTPDMDWLFLCFREGDPYSIRDTDPLQYLGELFPTVPGKGDLSYSIWEGDPPTVSGWVIPLQYLGG